MAFEGLSERLQEFTRKLRGKARITEQDLNDMLREVKLALLEADVNYKVVKEFIGNIHDKALGQDGLASHSVFAFVRQASHISSLTA